MKYQPAAQHLDTLVFTVHDQVALLTDANLTGSPLEQRSKNKFLRAPPLALGS